ncbi:MAG TPA: hypothetical protein VLA04_04470, partial [Verrucomicrobiae bacterium]|nr:hypothetical protein [Verrucomicrobiae bacterium]
MNLTDDARLSLESDICQWLATSPAEEDVLSYAAHLPEDNALVTYSAAGTFIHSLFQRKSRYFSDANCEDFVEDISEPDQFEIIVLFTQYNSRSVVKKYTAQYPFLSSLVLPPDLAEWSKKYVGNMNAAISLFTAHEYSRARLYLQSLKKVKSPEEIAPLL